ncbi:Glycosyl transferase, group 2 family protein [Desulfurella amilsii]|uniref:Glycosyl transferase, group 2 family protein n=1 Tax=Desulfurella amilsii TaxID=1562698 RepID=A0A1X4XUH1_9BACT|nr:glycosyltransferase family 2 protein [Desulfurella amilsii]OSS41185.1 Glycosyl transferase, group 2 family protein [Desulfurella amilsii]
MQENKAVGNQFKIKPKVSILVPTWNTLENFLTEMTQSVLNQTYANWELCIADGASNNNTKEVLKKYAQSDNRIKVKFLSENKGIAGNSNEAIIMSTGDYIVLLDHDDVLSCDALYEVVRIINQFSDADFLYSDEDKISEDGKKLYDQHFKPDFSPDMLRSYNYISHLCVIKKDLLDKVGYFREGFEGSQDYDLILRCTEQAKRIVHIPKILYHWRSTQESTSRNSNAKPYAFESAKKALREHLERIGLKGEIVDTDVLGFYRIYYEISSLPKVSIIIPNKDHKNDLEKCINSILKSTYKNYEIIIVENNSTEKSIFNYYDYLKATYSFINILEWEKPFNYAGINNFAAKFAKGDVLLFLNNDIEIINKDWLEEMLMFIQRDDVGIVGAKLYYPDNTIQHAGVIIGINKIAEHAFRYFPYNANGYFMRLKIVHNLSAVTGALLMTKKTIFNEVGGFDEGYTVAFNDIDYCLKVRQKKYLVVFTPHAKAYHFESKSLGYKNIPERFVRFNIEAEKFKSKWHSMLAEGDPYYNPNLTLRKTDFSIANSEDIKEVEKYSIDGIFYLRNGLIDKAKGLFQLALEKNLFNVDAVFCLGAFALEEKNYAGAIEKFNFLIKNNLIKHDVNLACVYNNLGTAFIKTGRKEDGVELIKKAYNLNNYYRDATENLEKINHNQDNFKITMKLIV